MASPMLSKEVMPALGPAHFSKHTETFVSQMLAPQLLCREIDLMVVETLLREINLEEEEVEHLKVVH